MTAEKKRRKTPRLTADGDEPSVAKAVVDELKTQVKALRRRVKKAEADAELWQRKAARQRAKARKANARAERAVAEATAKTDERGRRPREVIADHPDASPPVDVAAAPDMSWTVLRLRAAARERGVASPSRLRREQLVEALNIA